MNLSRSGSQRLSYSQRYIKRVKRRPEESKGIKESEGASVPAPVQTERKRKMQQKPQCAHMPTFLSTMIFHVLGFDMTDNLILMQDCKIKLSVSKQED